MDKTKKKRMKRYLLWGALGALVALLALMPLMAKSEVQTDGPQASILSGTVTTGNVGTALQGGGTLEAGEPEDITVPVDVKITEFLVKNGQSVTEGTPLATVDKVSVMVAITQVQETMDYLKEQMEDAADETVSATVSAVAGGRVKQVFAQAGDSVQDVMLEHGALAVLSLDGLMAVKIPCHAALSSGDSVQVTLKNGSKVSGRVESNLDGEIVVTVEDQGYAIGQQVTVATQAGENLGSGELYVHDAWSAAAITGTISAVYAKEEKTVSSGATLFTLTDREFTGQREAMASTYREYEELMQKLFRMYESGTIDAPCDGMVSGIDKDSAHLLSAGEEGWQAVPLDAGTESTGQGSGWKVMLLSNTTVECSGDNDCKLKSTNPADHKVGCPKACVSAGKNGTCSAIEHYKDCIMSCTHADNEKDCPAIGDHYSDCIKACVHGDAEGKCTATKHYADCIESCISSDGTQECPASKYHKTDCIKSCDKTESCPGTKNHYATCLSLCTKDENCEAMCHKEGCPLNGVTYTAQAALVSAVGEQILVRMDKTTVYTLMAGESGWILLDASGQPTTLNATTMVEEAAIAPSNKVSCAAGDIILIITAKNASGNVVRSNWVYVYQKGQSGNQMGDMSSMLAGMFGMSGMMGMGGTAGGSGFELFDLEGDVLMTVTPQETMSLSITLDEQDISKVQVGQTAQVKVEALRDQLFDAEVSKVAYTGTNNGGSSKFTVELSIPRQGQMLEGMSATASISMGTKMEVLTIPVAALTDNGAETVVYTAVDAETGELTQPVTVTVGISDGETAEILSGLKSGDTYYYSYYDVLEEDNSVEQQSKFAFG